MKEVRKIQTSKVQDPPTPTTATAPIIEGDLLKSIDHGIAYWTQAANDWQEMGKVFKVQECQAAAEALAQAAQAAR